MGIYRPENTCDITVNILRANNTPLIHTHTIKYNMYIVQFELRVYKICLDETTDESMYVCMCVSVCVCLCCPSWVRGLYVEKTRYNRF